MSLPSPRPFDHSSLVELQALLLESGTPHNFLNQLAKLTAQALPEGSSWGATVRQNSRPGHPWASWSVTGQVPVICVAA